MNPEDEKYAAQLIQQMKQQNQAMNPIKLPQRKSEQVLDGMNGMSEQAALSSVQSSSGPAPPAQGAFAVCPQCGIMHPPLQAGQKCPVAKIEIKEAGLKDEDISNFVINMRNIAISQIESKGIKEGNKLFKYLTVEFMKSLEGYKE